MKDHPGSGPAVLDVTEYLDQIGLRGDPRVRRPTTVAYQDACHLTHGQQVTAPPRRLLERIESVALVPVADAGLCCGSAGLYNLEQPALAADLGRRKAATLIAAPVPKPSAAAAPAIRVPSARRVMVMGETRPGRIAIPPRAAKDDPNRMSVVIRSSVFTGQEFCA